MRRILGYVVGGLVLLFGLTLLGARFSDGPIALFPGGPLASGDWVTSPVGDWSFASDLETIEMQLEGDSSSRTVWIAVKDGQAFIPCSLGFPPGKRWHRRADQDGRAILRMDGKRYRVELVRTKDAALGEALKQVVSDKYPAPPPSDDGVWFFSITSRAS